MGSMTSAHCSFCTGTSDRGTLFNYSGLGRPLCAGIEPRVQVTLDPGGDLQDPAPGAVGEPVLFEQFALRLQVPDRAGVILGAQVDLDPDRVEPDRQDRPELGQDLLDLLVDRLERIDMKLGLRHRGLDPGRGMGGSRLGVHGVAGDGGHDLAELHRLQLVPLFGRDLDIPLLDDLGRDLGQVQGVEGALEVFVGDLLPFAGVLEDLLERKLVGEVHRLAVLDRLDRSGIDEHLESGAGGLPPGDHRVIDLDHRNPPRSVRPYEREFRPGPPVDGSRATYFWVSSPVRRRSPPAPRSMVHTSTWARVEASSSPARRPSRARRIAASRSRPSLYFCSSSSMTGPLLPPVEVALKLLSEPDGSVSKRWIPESSYPPTRRAVPKGRTPPYWVYCCL